MKGATSGLFENINNPYRKDPEHRKFLAKANEGYSWEEDKDICRKGAERLYEDHMLVERAKREADSLVEKYGSISKIPKKYFEENFEKTPYQPSLAAAVYEMVWEKAHQPEN